MDGIVVEGSSQPESAEELLDEQVGAQPATGPPGSYASSDVFCAQPSPTFPSTIDPVAPDRSTPAQQLLDDDEALDRRAGVTVELDGQRHAGPVALVSSSQLNGGANRIGGCLKSAR